MATVAVQTVSPLGTALVFNAASGGGDKFLAGDHVTVIVKNGDGSSHTPTFVTPNTAGGFAIADDPVAVAAGAEVEFGPWPAAFWADQNGLMSITWSATTGMTFAVRTS